MLLKTTLMMEDQISLVRYFADVSKLVTICYKLSLEKQDLLKKTQYHQESQSQNKQKKSMIMKSSDQFNDKNQTNQQGLENQEKIQDKKKNILSKTRSGKNFYKRLIQKKFKVVQQEKETFDCQECNKKYYHMKSLKRHIKWNHQKIKLTNSIEK